MARTRTLAQLRTEVLQTADMENVGSFIDISTGGEVDRYINASIQDLYDTIIEVMGQEYFLKSDTFTTIAGTSEYSVVVADDDFYQLYGVDWESGDNKWPLTPYEWQDRHQDNIAWSTFRDQWGGYPCHYRLFGDQNAATGVYTPRIRLTPEPTSVQTVRLWYVPHPPLLDADADVFDGFNGWEEYVVVDAAIKLLQKEESDTQALELRKSRLLDRIRSMASKRDMNYHQVIADVEDYE